VHGARISVDIPKRRLTVFTGASSAGTSCLVFNTIAAESQRLIPKIQKSMLSKDRDALQVRSRGINIADACAMQISDLAEWVRGLGYLSLDQAERQAGHLDGHRRQNLRA
jgi:hypothetical protein